MTPENSEKEAVRAALAAIDGVLKARATRTSPTFEDVLDDRGSDDQPSPSPTVEGAASALFSASEPNPAARLKPSARPLPGAALPANDDQAGAATPPRRAVQATSGAGPMIATSVSAVVWLALCGAYGWHQYEMLGAGPAWEALARPENVMLALAALIPSLFLFMFAAHERQLRDLRGAADALARAAAGLVGPPARTDACAVLFESIRDQMAALGEGVARAQERADAEMAGRERSVIDAEDQMRGLVAELARENEAIAANAEGARRTAADAQAGLLDVLDRIAYLQAENTDSPPGAGAAGSEAWPAPFPLGSRNEALAEAFAARARDTTAALEISGAEIAERIVAAGAIAVESVQRLCESLSTRVGEATRALVDDFSERGEAFAVSIEASRAKALEDVYRLSVAAAEDFETRGRVVVERMQAGAAEVALSLSGFETAIAWRGEAIANAIAEQRDGLERELRSVETLLGEHGDNAAQRIGDRFREDLAKTDAMLTARNAEFDAKTADYVNALAEARRAERETMETAAQAHRATIDSTLHNHFGEALAKFEASIEKRGVSAARTLQFQSEAIARRWTELGLGHSRDLEARIGALATALETRLATLATILDERGEPLAAGLSRLADQLQDLIATRGAALETTLATSTDRLAAALSEKSEQARALIETCARDLGAGIEAASLQTVAAIDRHGAMAREGVSDTSRAFAASWIEATAAAVSAGGRLRENLNEHLMAMEATLGPRANALIAALAERRHELERELRAIERSVDEGGAFAIERVEAAGDALTARIARTTQTVAQDFVARGEALIQRLDAGREESLAAIGLQNEAIARDFGAHNRDLLENLRQGGAAVALALQAQADAACARLAEALERAPRDFEPRVDGVLIRLEACRVALATVLREHGEPLADHLTRAVDRLRETVAERGIAFERTLADSANGALARLGEIAEGAGRRIASASGDAATRIFAGGDAWRAALDERLSEFQAAIGARGGALTSALVDHRRGFERELRALEGLIGEGSATAVQRIAAVSSRVCADARQAADALAHRLAESAGSIGRDFDERGRDVIEGMQARGASLARLLQTQAEAALAPLAKAGGDLMAQIAPRLTDLTDRLDAARASMTELLGDSGEALATRWRGAADRLQDLIAANGRALDDALAETARETRLRGVEAAAMVAASADGFGKQCDERLGAFEAAVGARGGALIARLAQHEQTFSAAVAGGIEASEARWAHRLRETGARVEAAGARLDEALASRGTAIVEAIAKNGDALLEGLSGAEHRIARAISVQSAEISSLAESRLATVAATLDERGAALAASLEASRGQLVDTFAQLATRTIDGFRAGAAAAAGTLSEFTALVDETLGRRLGEFEASVGGGARRFAGEIVAPLTELAERIHADGARLAAGLQWQAEELDRRSGAFMEAVGDRTDALHQALESKLQALRATVASATSELEGVLAARGGAFAATASAGLDQIRAVLDGSGGELTAALTAGGGQLSEQISSVGQRAAQALEQRVSILIGTLTRRGDDLLGAMNTSASESARAMGALTGRIQQEVEASAAAFRSAVEAARRQTGEPIAMLLDRLAARGVGLARGTPEAAETLAALDAGAASDSVRGTLFAYLVQDGRVFKLAAL